jgi:hypothetical protein
MQLEGMSKFRHAIQKLAELLEDTECCQKKSVCIPDTAFVLREGKDNLDQHDTLLCETSRNQLPRTAQPPWNPVSQHSAYLA